MNHLERYRSRLRRDSLKYRATNGMKLCRGCGETKPVSEYVKNRSLPDGLQGRCKPCFYEHRGRGVYASWRKAKEQRRQYLPPAGSELYDYVIGTPNPPVVPSPYRANFLDFVVRGAKYEHVERHFRLLGIYPNELAELLSQEGLSFPPPAPKPQRIDEITDARRAHLQELSVRED